jgi:hypothetical protein
MYEEVLVMASVELTTEQVVNLVLQLPAERKQEVLMALASESEGRRNTRMAYAEEQLRQLCARRGLNWDSMTEEQREALADDLIHEDRSCAQ